MATISHHNVTTGQIEVIELDDHALLEHLTGEVGEAAHHRMAAENAYLEARQQAEIQRQQALHIVRAYALGDPYPVAEVLRALCQIVIGG